MVEKKAAAAPTIAKTEPLSEAYDDVEALARAMWLLRERRFPAHTRQRWEQGTLLARGQMLTNARRRLDTDPLYREVIEKAKGHAAWIEGRAG